MKAPFFFHVRVVACHGCPAARLTAVLEPRQGNQFGSGGVCVWGGDMEAIILSRRKRGGKKHGVAPMKAREASAAFSTRPLIETCRCFEVAQNS